MLDGAYLDSLSTDDETQAHWHDLATGSATIQRHEGPIPYIVLILDKTVHLWLCEEDGDTIGLLESENSAVLAWAEDIISDYLDQAQPFEPSLEV